MLSLYIFLLFFVIPTCQQIPLNSSAVAAPITTNFPLIPSPSAAGPLPTISLKIGLLFANQTQGMRSLYGFGQSAPAITLAIRRANLEHLADNVNLTFEWFMSECSQALTIGHCNRMINVDGVDAIIGPPCVTSALTAGFAATYYNIPIFLWGASVASDLNNPLLYPTVANINSNTNMLAIALRSLLITYGWVEVALVYIPDDTRRVCAYFQQDFENLFNNDTAVTVVFKRKLDSTSASMKDALNALKSRARIVVSCFDNVDDRRNFLLAIHDLKLDQSNEYVFIFTQLRSLGMMQQIADTKNGAAYDFMWLDTDPTKDGKDGRDEDAKAAARISIVIDLQNQSSDVINQFITNMTAEFGKFPFFCSGSCMGGPNEQIPSTYSRHLFDATYAYLRALNKTMEHYGVSRDIMRNGTLLTDMSKNDSYKGLTGEVIIDQNGNRQPTFYVTMMDAVDMPQAIIQITIAANVVSSVLNYTSEAVLWANRGGQRPLNKPKCGYTGLECPQDMSVYIFIGSGILLLLIIAVFGIGGYAIRERMRERERLTRECLIPFEELRNLKELKSVEELRSNEGKSMRSLQSSISGSSKLTSMDNKKLETDNYAFFAYNREVVFGTKYQVKVKIFSDDLVHLRKLRQLDNENLNKFYGVCIDAPILYAIWRHCQRGSLKDVIAKEQYVGDNFVMFTLMRDIAASLIAIHQSFIGCHGLLTSECCLINDRWQVKISDFGLNMIREGQPMARKKMLWTAPELLRESNRTGTKEGDVFSFAIICTELLNKESVWNGVEREDDIDEILYRLKRANSAVPHRPQLHPREDNNNQNMIHLIRECWAERPSERPKMELVRTMMKQMVRDGNQNLMDYVFGMLEQYATSLEQEVDERTKELVEEKRKSDILLYRMLPKQVADKLKVGESVEPEQFQAATVFFSDVVSFTTLASKCTPLQVVNLLNSLYTSFDGIIDSHDVYKVETIGDGYLVCSGIPRRNGDNHAKEIAELSFAFLRSVSSFRVDHLPTERVNLRIGFHTGPAVAGVVGLTMPRYCLFGDTVNTASRMESNGKPGRIHVSSTANHYLTNIIGGYVTETRGEVIIKGKGVMETYWLLGHAGDANMVGGGRGRQSPEAQLFHDVDQT